MTTTLSFQKCLKTANRQDSAPPERASSNGGNVGIGVVLEWDPDSDKHTVKRFVPAGPAALSGCMQVKLAAGVLVVTS